MFSGLAGRIRIAALFLSLVPLVCGGLLLIFLSVSANRNQAAQLQIERAARAAKTLDAYLQKAQAAVEQVSSTRSLTDLDAAAQMRVLDGVRLADSAFVGALVLDIQGNVRTQLPPTPDVPPVVRDAITSVRGTAEGGATTFSDAYTNPATANPEVVIGGPAYNSAGAVAGSVFFRVDLTFFLRDLNALSIGTTGYAYIVDSRGNMIARKNSRVDLVHRQNLRDLPPVAGFLRLGPLPDAGNFPATFYTGLNGSEVLGTYFSFSATDWAVVAELPTAEVDAPLVQMLLVLAGALLVTLAVVVLVALVTVRWLVRPLQVLQQGAEQVGAGNYHLRIEELDTNDELDALARTFNQMTANLESNQAALQTQMAQTDALLHDTAERAARLEVLIEVSRAVSSTLDPESLYSTMAEQVRRVVGYDWLGLALPGDAGAMLRIAYSTADATDAPAAYSGYHVGAKLPIGSGPDIAYRSCQPILVADTSDDSALYATISLREAGFRSFVALPIERNRDVLGVLIASSRSPDAFNAEQRDLLSAICVQLAIALNNSRIYQRLQSAASIR